MTLYKTFSPDSRGRGKGRGSFYTLFMEKDIKKTAACAAAQFQVIFVYPALAVWTRLKPARDGRWVASTMLYCFQLPADLNGGREACKPRREGGVPFKKCGFKRAHHAPSRKVHLKSTVIRLPLRRSAP